MDYLDRVIEKAAAKAGVTYLDTRHVFDGHRLCDTGDKAANGLTKGDDRLQFIAQESYHPNAYGNELLADFIAQATNNLSSPMPAPQNIVNPTADDSLPILQAVSNMHQQIYDIQNVNTTTEELLFAGSSYTVPSSSSPANLAPNSAFSAVLHSTPTQLGTIFTDANGTLTGGLQIPANVPAGFHTIHYYGKNIAGDPVDIQDVVYVAASENDYDYDGVLNANDSCPSIPQSGEDVDKDGIDDACDGQIGPAPAATGVVVLTVDNTKSSFELVLSNTRNTTVHAKPTAAASPEQALTILLNKQPQVLHAQTSQKATPTVKGAALTELNISNRMIFGTAVASLGLLTVIVLFLIRLQRQ